MVYYRNHSGLKSTSVNIIYLLDFRLASHSSLGDQNDCCADYENGTNDVEHCCAHATSGRKLCTLFIYYIDRSCTTSCNFYASCKLVISLRCDSFFKVILYICIFIKALNSCKVLRIPLISLNLNTSFASFSYTISSIFKYNSNFISSSCCIIQTEFCAFKCCIISINL